MIYIRSYEDLNILNILSESIIFIYEILKIKSL